MTRKKISRNAPCPCGSGKKYKQCCYRKDFDWTEDEEGSVSRAIPASDELMGVLGRLHEQFVARHGREPGPNDRLFDGAPPLEHMEHWTVEAMKKADVDPAIIHAYEETGLMLSEKNENLVPESDVAEWEAAIDAYEQKHGLRDSRRRLTEDDLQAILANGPQE